MKSKVIKNINMPIIILGVGVLLIISGVVLTVSNHFSNQKIENMGENPVNNTTSFFIKNKEGKYALFNIDGKKLTDFQYTSTNKFIGDTANVGKDGKVGIITSAGKTSVDFGKYNYISQVAGLYKAQKDKDGYIINGKGKVLYNMKEADLKTYSDADTYSILEDKKKNNYYVLNYQGKTMATFPIIKNQKDPTTSEKDGYLSVFYNGVNKILNIATGKEMISFNDKQHYCINTVKEGKMILNSCTSWSESQEKAAYKVFENGKIIDISTECDTAIFDNDHLICTKNHEQYLLDNNYKKSLHLSYVAYANDQTFAQKKKNSFGEVEIYDNGKLTKTIPCRTIGDTGYMPNGLYVLRTYFSKECNMESGSYEFYNKNGEKAIEKTFTSAESFDSNGNTKVSENKKDYYLMDSKGRKLSDFYDEIRLAFDYYIVTKDNKKGMLGKAGNEIVPCQYNSIDIRENQNRIYAILKTSDNKTSIYSLDNKKTLLTSDKSVELNSNYILVSDNKIKQYYTLTRGKLFYEE